MARPFHRTHFYAEFKNPDVLFRSVRRIDKLMLVNLLQFPGQSCEMSNTSICLSGVKVMDSVQWASVAYKAWNLKVRGRSFVLCTYFVLCTSTLYLYFVKVLTFNQFSSMLKAYAMLWVKGMLMSIDNAELSWWG